MKRTIAITAAALMLGTACAVEPVAPPVPASLVMVSRMLDYMQVYSVRRDSVDWTWLRESVMSSASYATTPAEVEGSMALALRLLDDNASYVASPNGYEIKSPTTVECTGTVTKSWALVPADVGYVRVGAFSGRAFGEGAYIDSIEAAMQDADSPSLAGWIIDLRGHYGGDMWSALAALAPFLQGYTGYFVGRDSTWTVWHVQGADIFAGRFRVMRSATPFEPIDANHRIAVLTDERVASSGEAIAIAFKQRADTRSFGSNTCGLTTATTTHSIGNGYALSLASVRMADRNLNVYRGAVPVDEAIVDPDSVVIRAVAWLRSGTP